MCTYLTYPVDIYRVDKSTYLKGQITQGLLGAGRIFKESDSHLHFPKMSQDPVWRMDVDAVRVARKSSQEAAEESKSGMMAT